MTAFKTLEDMNVALCKETGAGHGVSTTQAASDRYYAALAQRAASFRQACADAFAENLLCPIRNREHYIAGLDQAISHALRAYPQS